MPDIVVVGAGSNSLTTACFLAKAGLDVLVLERNQEAGGGVVSVETAPGFINDSHAMGFMTLMPNPVIKDDELELKAKFGLEWCYNDSPFGTLFSDGTGLISYFDIERTCAEIAKFSERDADAYRAFVKEVSIYLPLLTMGFYTPPMPDTGFKNLLSQSDEGRKLLRFLDMSVMDILNERFEHPAVKIHFGKWCSEMMIAPDTKGAGIAIVLILNLSHKYNMGTVKGGAANLTNSLIRCLAHHGGTIRYGTTVEKLVMEAGQCVGVALENGDVIHARKSVVANIHPWRLKEMVEGIPDHIAKKAANVKLSDYGAINQQFALSEVPKYKAGDIYDGVTVLEIVKKDYDAFLATYNDYTNGRMDLDNLSLLVGVQSNADPSRAPEGKSAVYLYSFAPFKHEDGWDNKKMEVADALFDWFASATTNIDRSKILGRLVETPEDHARHSRNMMHGDIMGCAMGYGQLMGGRPFPELSHYTIPEISRLYLAGPMQHPGGTVTLGGRATAMKMLDDFDVHLSTVFKVY